MFDCSPVMVKTGPDWRKWVGTGAAKSLNLFFFVKICGFRKFNIACAVWRTELLTRLLWNGCHETSRTQARWPSNFTAIRPLRMSYTAHTADQGPNLQNILRQSYDYLTIMPKLRSTYDGPSRTSNLQNLLRRTQGFSEARFTCKVVRSSETVFAN